MINSIIKLRYMAALTLALAAPLVWAARPAATATIATAQTPSAELQQVVISQVYAGGGLPGAVYRNDFVELHNRGASTADLNGVFINFATDTGTIFAKVGFVSSRGYPLGPGQYLLVQLGSSGPNGSLLPVTADANIPNLNLNLAGKLALTAPGVDLPISATCPLPNEGIVDYVGYGSTASCFEGAGPTPALSAALAVARKDNGCTDTNNNAADFAATTPTPRSTSSPAQICILNTIQFSESGYPVAESATSAVLTVTRTGDTSTTSTVNYFTDDDQRVAALRCDDTTNTLNIASPRCDYATTIDTLTFAPGETQKQIIVPIIDDAHVEQQEVFLVRLSSPNAGSALGTTTTATVIIGDNDTTGQPNPIFTTPFFVRLQYLDFLSREPEAGEPWSNVLNNCPDVNNLDPNSASANCDRITVSGAFFGSPEFRLKGFYVFRFYKLAFDRLPQYSEIIPDMRAVTGATPAEVFQKKAQFATGFASRTEFVNLYSSKSNTDYVAALMNRYNLTAITTPDPNAPDGEQKVTLTSADLVNRLNIQTMTRAQVLRAVADSDQVGTAEFTRAFVAMQYYGYLRRTPEDGGYQAWLNYLTAHPSDFRMMINGFMNSQEYRLRFGRDQ